MNRKILVKVLLLAISLLAIIYSKMWLSDHAQNLALNREIENSQQGL